MSVVAEYSAAIRRYEAASAKFEEIGASFYALRAAVESIGAQMQDDGRLAVSYLERSEVLARVNEYLAAWRSLNELWKSIPSELHNALKDPDTVALQEY